MMVPTTAQRPSSLGLRTVFQTKLATSLRPAQVSPLGCHYIPVPASKMKAIPATTIMLLVPGDDSSCYKHEKEHCLTARRKTNQFPCNWTPKNPKPLAGGSRFNGKILREFAFPRTNPASGGRGGQLQTLNVPRLFARCNRKHQLAKNYKADTILAKSIQNQPGIKNQRSRKTCQPPASRRKSASMV